ncbi:hypothetical protein A9G24_10360 [Gilliamella sp. App6-5]|uniref:D-glycero-beta-D-manno-heptose-7-phosphate kinase n=1 Tax=Gilliamella sp. App6-5 TaxID=3120232 RepID=UPI00080DF2C9|nr:D-glycero-beta-D-manno-heptose-7-phosphate kinase [Gilliamella apicola]OCG10410.1 hypothetical protein A9G24_10360 [Gilliamella apicola]
MNEFYSYLDKFKYTKVTVIGDIMLDRFLYGTVDRISPEAPVPIFKLDREEVMLGGAGNVAANLAKLGCKPTFLGFVGCDVNGKLVASLLKSAGSHSHLYSLKNHPTIIKTRFIANHNHLLRADEEKLLPFIPELLPKFYKLVMQAIKMTDIVLLSDYNKGILNQETTQMIINLCNEFNIPVIVDPKGNDYSKYRGATLIKPNIKEFFDATGIRLNPEKADFDDELKRGADIIFQRYGIKNIIVTLSEYGMAYISCEDKNCIVKIPTEAKEVFDVSGAGDTSLATLGIALGAKIPLAQAMQLANIASGIVVGKLGTATVSFEELKHKLSAKKYQNHCCDTNKYISLKEVKPIIRNLQKQGKKIGFTNGCFDLLHLGHLSSLTQTKKLCDILVVGVNSDESIKKYKGNDRPIQDQNTRATLLASLEFVDYVIVFNDDDASCLVDELRPDIIAKEGYSVDNWPEAQKVIGYGGKAIILERVEGYSTSQLVAKCKEKA